MFDQKKIKEIALSRFHDKHFDTPIEFAIFCVEVYLKENGCIIVNQKRYLELALLAAENKKAEGAQAGEAPTTNTQAQD